MKKNESFSLAARRKSFIYALRGISFFFNSEHNSILHLAGTIVVITLLLVFPVSHTEAAILILAVGFVWVAEIFNTCVEKIMDFISEERRPQIKYIKDLAAAAVLVAAFTAVITGLLVFIPKL
jgi:diacylglycerol kinase (ATP)